MIRPSFGIHAMGCRSVHSTWLGLLWYDLRSWLYDKTHCPDHCHHIACMRPPYEGS